MEGFVHGLIGDSNGAVVATHSVEEGSTTTTTKEDVMQSLARWLRATASSSSSSSSAVRGIIGGSPVILHRDYGFGTFDLDSTRLVVTSRSNFASVRSNAAVWSGKWQYECTILSGGLAQIGWSQLSCKFTHEMGVGDVPGSFSYDGHRCKKWSVTAKDYGLEWAKGDVITVALDCDERTASFYRNGVAMGVAYTDLAFGADVAYFASASLSEGESVRFNFGASPLRYGVAGFSPLVAVPKERHEALGKILGAFGGLLELCDQGAVSVDEYVMGSAHIWTSMVSVLDDYTLVSQLVRFVRALLPKSNQMRMFVQSMLWSCERAEVTWIVWHLATWLGYECVSHAYHTSNPPLEMVCALLETSPALLGVFLEHPRLEGVLEDMFATKSSTDADLSVLLPKMAAFWKSESALNSDPLVVEAARADVEALHQSLATHEARLWRLFTVLQGSDAFVEWLLRVARKKPQARTQSSQINVFYLLLQRLSQQYDAVPGLIAPWVVSLPAERMDLPRLGGLLSYLQKEFPCPATGPAWSGADPSLRHFHVMLEALLSLYSSLIASRFKNLEMMMSSFSKLDKELHAQNPPNAGRLLQAQQLCRVLCYSAIVLMAPAKQSLLCRATNFVCGAMNKLSVQTPNAFGYLPQYFLSFVLETMRVLLFLRLPRFTFVGAPHESALREFLVFLVAHMHDARIANPEVRDSLLQNLSFYLSTRLFSRLAESSALAREKMIPLLLQDPTRNWVAVAMTLLRFWRGVGFGLETPSLGKVVPVDVEADLREFREAVSTGAPTTTAVGSPFYNPLSSQGRALVSQWCKPNTALASVVFQGSMQALCDQEPPTVMANFLNQLFNTLNWCISEFSVGMDEYKSASQDRRKDTSPIQKKCLVMFELGGSLMRILEIVTMHGARRLFGERVNMQRAMEACLSILERTILFPDKARLDQLLRRHNLQTALHDRTVMFPTFGALVNLYRADATLMVDTLVLQAALTPAVLAFMQKAAAVGTEGADYATLSEMLTLVESKLHQKQEEEKAGIRRIASVELCPICYSGAINTRFLPCQHTSCADCIQRHLLNSKKCFFCNAEIQRTETINK